MIFRSPSRNASVEIWQPRVENSWGGRGDIVSKAGTFRIFDVREAFFYFVHVYWSPDEEVVGFFCGSAFPMEMAFRVKSGQQVAFDEVRAALAASIREQYGVPSEQDPIEWAMTTDASMAFFARHPEIDVSYHTGRTGQPEMTPSPIR
jgi:hypothetical protein